MCVAWWLQIRQQLGLPRMTWYEAEEELRVMSMGDQYEYMFQAMYGHFEGMHPYNDAQWWLSTYK